MAKEIKMKNIIHDLETALKNLSFVDPGIVYKACEEPFYDAVAFIKDALNEIKKTPQWETPEQYKARTGKAWAEDWAVYFRICTDKFGGFTVYTYKDALRLYDMAVAHTGITPEYQIVCATEAGPPPDDWRPEGGIEAVKKFYEGGEPC
jgi:hypothetical protein